MARLFTAILIDYGAFVKRVETRVGRNGKNGTLIDADFTLSDVERTLLSGNQLGSSGICMPFFFPVKVLCYTERR
jgi:hypothetical protein